jgi:hypothetical protein
MRPVYMCPLHTRSITHFPAKLVGARVEVIAAAADFPIASSSSSVRTQHVELISRKLTHRMLNLNLVSATVYSAPITMSQSFASARPAIHLHASHCSSASHRCRDFSSSSLLLHPLRCASIVIAHLSCRAWTGVLEMYFAESHHIQVHEKRFIRWSG